MQSSFSATDPIWKASKQVFDQKEILFEMAEG